MDMSTLAQAKKWEQSSLPPKEQLKLHLDEKQFLRYMMHDAIFSEKVDIIAQLLRDKYNVLENSIAVTGDNTSMPSAFAALSRYVQLVGFPSSSFSMSR